MSLSLVYVFAASGMEAQPVRRMGVPSGSSSILRCGPNDVVLVTSGMGPRNAGIKADAALRTVPDAFVTSKPNAVLIIGLCGGLTASLPEGRIFAYTNADRSKLQSRCTNVQRGSRIRFRNCSSHRASFANVLSGLRPPGSRRRQKAGPLSPNLGRP